MCGISGIIGPLANQDDITRMVRIQTHRGPDDNGIFGSGECFLGHNRLSIIDRSSAGHQPMSDNDKRYSITFNGEIYNYIEIRHKIGSRYRFASHTDTEVILASYIIWGEKCLEYLNGMFSFAIYDTEQKILFCARDRIGIKPFYYKYQRNTFYFASEIKAILSTGVEAIPNDNIIATYLIDGYYNHSTETFFKNIYSLPPGHKLLLKNNQISITPYWELNRKIDSQKQGGKLNGRMEELHTLLHDSVRLRLRSDVPVGIHLSGGIDSSLLLAYMDREIDEGQIKAFTGVYGSAAYDEGVYAEKIVKNLGINHNFIEFPLSQFWDIFDKMVWHEDQPFGGLATMLNYVIDDFVKKSGVTVVLEGQGGEELFGGYNYYFFDFLNDIEQSYPDKLDNLIHEYCSFHDTSYDQIVSQYYNCKGKAYSNVYTDGTTYLKPDCLDTKFKKNYYEPIEFDSITGYDFVNARYRDLFHTKLQRVMRFIDIASMAHGVELRVPILDHRIVEFAFNLPFISFYQCGESKVILRKLARVYNLLPSSLINRPKHSVANPQREWFKNELADDISYILANSVLYDTGYLDRKKVTEMFNNYRNTKNPQNSVFIWQCINLDRWYRKFIL